MANVILMGSGELLNLEAPEAWQFNIEDIARSLSRLPRFCGHTDQFYSVAQHSVFVSDMLADTPYAYEGLMHEITEACGLGDIASPMKKMLGTEARRAINAHEERLCEIFGVIHPFPKEVYVADIRALVTEFSQLFSTGSEKALKYFPGIEPYPIVLEPLSPEDAYELFLHRYDSLMVGYDE